MTAATTASLPETLRPWFPWLDWFTPALAASLGEILARLDPLVGRFEGRRAAGAEEPDGLGDLRRRGPYERLLTSEWLLAADVPDEFLRRAASGEHLFLAPQPRGRRPQRLVVALFDAGPRQLGAPRLVQLALWILLARRAVGAGGTFRWGVLQQPGVLHDALRPEDLLALLGARTYETGGPAGAQAWSPVLEAMDFGECWHVGPGPRRHDAATHLAWVRPALFDDTLDVEVGRPGATRRAELPLGDADQSVPLLKGRFQGMPVPKARSFRSDRLSIRIAPLFSDDGRYVVVPLLEGTAVSVFPLNALGEPARGRTRTLSWAAGSEPLAGAMRGKQLVLLLSAPGGGLLRFWQSQIGVVPRPDREHFHAPPQVGRWLDAFMMGSSVFVLDASRRLVFWAGPPVRGPMLRAKEVHAVAAIDHSRFAFVAEEQGMLKAFVSDTGARVQVTHPLGPVRSGEGVSVLIGPASRWRNGFGGCAVRGVAADFTAVWDVHEPVEGGVPPVVWRSEPTRAVVFGLTAAPGGRGSVLVALSPSRRDLLLIGPTGFRTVWSSPETIERQSVHAESGRVALLTADRALVVFSVPENAVLLRVRSGEEGRDD